jgi:hypothetical protein
MRHCRHAANVPVSVHVYGGAAADKGQASWQGYSAADWQVPGGGGRRGAGDAGAPGFECPGQVRQPACAAGAALKLIEPLSITGTIRIPAIERDKGNAECASRIRQANLGACHEIRKA